MERETPEDLVTRCLAGKRSAGERLYAVLRDRVYWVVARSVGSCDGCDPDDIFAEVVERVFRNLGSYKRDLGTFLSWARAIGRNRASDCCDRSKTRENAAAPEHPGGTMDPDGTLDARNRLARVAAAMETLTERQQAVLTFYAVEGLSHREIAQNLAITAEASRQHLAAARNRIRDFMGET